jgi:hypothetical protein
MYSRTLYSRLASNSEPLTDEVEVISAISGCKKLFKSVALIVFQDVLEKHREDLSSLEAWSALGKALVSAGGHPAIRMVLGHFLCDTKAGRFDIRPNYSEAIDMIWSHIKAGETLRSRIVERIIERGDGGRRLVPPRPRPLHRRPMM